MLTRVHRALVLYNAAVANASAGQNPVLVVGGQQMAAWIHSPQGVDRRPGRPVCPVCPGRPGCPGCPGCPGRPGRPGRKIC
jgi:hypothetical protein